MSKVRTMKRSSSTCEEEGVLLSESGEMKFPPPPPLDRLIIIPFGALVLIGVLIVTCIGVEEEVVVVIVVGVEGDGGDAFPEETAEGSGRDGVAAEESGFGFAFEFVTVGAPPLPNRTSKSNW